MAPTPDFRNNSVSPLLTSSVQTELRLVAFFPAQLHLNLAMDRIANRPRGFAFLHYATEEESKRAIEGMHRKFLDGRVIFVEPAKPRSELRQNKQAPTLYQC